MTGQGYDPFRPRTAPTSEAADSFHDDGVEWVVYVRTADLRFDPDGADGAGRVTLDAADFPDDSDWQPQVGHAVVVLVQETFDTDAEPDVTYEGVIVDMSDDLVAVNLNVDEAVEAAGSMADSTQDSEQQPDSTVGAGDPENGTQGVALYDVDAVPSTAADVVAWIGEAESDDDRMARAVAAWQVEQADHAGSIRKTVQAAVAGIVEGVPTPD